MTRWIATLLGLLACVAALSPTGAIGNEVKPVPLVPGYLGVRVEPISDDLAKAVGVEAGEGELVAAVEPKGPADKVGIKAGDVILSVNNKVVGKPERLGAMIAGIPAGRTVMLLVLRSGKRTFVSVVPVARPSEEQLAAGSLAEPADQVTTASTSAAATGECRDLTSVVYVDGKEVREKRTMCRNAQGSWQPVGQPSTSSSPVTVAAAPSPPALPTVIPAAPRVALLIGNSAYDARFGSLANPVRDAAAMGAALRASGFEVEVVQNADQKAMKRAMQRFGQRLAKAGRQATGLFFYAGHGVQSAGANYLVPINAAIENRGDVDLEAVAAESVLRQMEAAGISTSIVILDACRNMPLARATRDGSRGLARMDAPNGSFIAYSTAPGQVAADGSGGNSPFTAALIAEIAKPGQEIQRTFLNVRRAVHQASGGKQVPWESSSLLDTFVFTPTR